MIIRCPDCGGNMKYEDFFEAPQKNGFYCRNEACEHKELDIYYRDENGRIPDDILDDQFAREV